jgi:hypothetical protein
MAAIVPVGEKAQKEKADGVDAGRRSQAVSQPGTNVTQYAPSQARMLRVCCGMRSTRASVIAIVLRHPHAIHVLDVMRVMG